MQSDTHEKKELIKDVFKSLGLYGCVMGIGFFITGWIWIPIMYLVIVFAMWMWMGIMMS